MRQFLSRSSRIAPLLREAIPSALEGSREKDRLLFVDLMRGLAMLVMIEVHVVNGLMQTGYRQAPWFGLLDFINGLVAPSFLFISGFAFLLASQRNLPALRQGGAVFRRTLGRIGLIWFLGYLLHVPSFSLRAWLQSTTSEQWLQFFSVDILQCIACGLLIFFVARLLITNERGFTAVVILLLWLSVLPAPWVWAMDIGQSLPLMLASYLSPVGSTLFPLLPWMGFMAAGVLTCRFFLRASEQGGEVRLMWWLTLMGGVLCAVGHPLLFYFQDTRGMIVDERPHVLFFAIRLGWVLLLLVFCYAVCRGRQRLADVLHAFSQESLLVYVFHLQILYRPLWEGKSLVAWAGQQLSFTASLLLALVLIGMMLPIARGWHLVKKQHHLVNRRLVTATLLSGTLLFLLG